MTADVVGCQCRRIRLLRCNFAVRHQTKFDQCLETITDTKSQTISLVEQLHNSLFQFFISESRSNEFTGTVRFITG